ncbi:MAG: ABC transporter substrate-binding protein [Gammaproteobacteria bacterium]|nr:ABC transporter substrate-binding protein [Gammaproteobacteria bacterium]
MKKFYSAYLLTFSIFIGSAAAQTEVLFNVPIGITPALSTAGLFIAYEQGYFRAQGINLIMNHVPRAGAQMIPFLASGQLLVGCGNLNAGLYNAIANDIPIKVVADKGTVTPNHGYLALLVRKAHVDSGRYKTLGDLKGMTIALTARGVSQEIVLEKYLHQAQLNLSDVRLINLSWGDMNVALANGAIDATIQVEPLVAKAVENGIAVRVKGDDEVYPNQQSAVIMYSPVFINKHPEMAKRFMVAYVKGMRDYNDAFENNINKEAIIDILLKHTKVKDRATYDKVANVGLNPDAMLNIETMRADAQWLYQKRYIKNPADVDNIAELRFINYARKVLGPYTPNKAFANVNP